VLKLKNVKCEEGAQNMLIQCTKKLLDELKVTPEAPIEVDPLFAWHANVLKLGRKKALVLVNDKNRYVIVLYGLKAKEWKKIDVLIKEAIREVFQAECIKEELIEQFISSSERMVFSKTKDRTAVARLNNSSEYVYHFGELIDPVSIVQKDLSLKISTLLVGDGKKSYYHPSIVQGAGGHIRSICVPHGGSATESDAGAEES